MTYLRYRIHCFSFLIHTIYHPSWSSLHATTTLIESTYTYTLTLHQNVLFVSLIIYSDARFRISNAVNTFFIRLTLHSLPCYFCSCSCYCFCSCSCIQFFSCLSYIFTSEILPLVHTYIKRAVWIWGFLRVEDGGLDW